MAAHNIERTVKFFCVENNIKEVFITDVIEHIYGCSHDQGYQSPETVEAIKQRFEQFINGKLFKKRNKLRQIFSLVNKDKHKILTILGVKIKFRRKTGITK